MPHLFNSTGLRIKYFHYILIMSLFLYPYLFNISLLELDGWLIALAIYFLTGCLGITMTFHRCLTHQSFKFKYKWMERLGSYLGSINGTGSPLGWVVVHWEHHKHADTDKDPHSPDKGLLFLKNDQYDNLKFNLIEYRHILKDKFQIALHQYYFLFIVLHITILAICFGFYGVYYGFIVPTLIGVITSIINNTFSHSKLGYKRYKQNNDSSNVWWVALLTFGEGLHNNHHAEPWEWNFSRAWYEIDITGKIIKFMLSTKLAIQGEKW
jgi:fatty-acid desaturase